MAGIKYQFKSRLEPTMAPLTAAVGMALSATTLQAAVITVDTLSDGSVVGQCTLRDAMQAAYSDAAVAGCAAGSGPDEIQFAGGLSGTITLTGGYIGNQTDVTISGPGPDLLTISGNDSDRIFVSYAPLSIDGLTLADGATNQLYGGSAILSIGSELHLSDCEIFENDSGTAAYGGAVTLFNATATISQCEFEYNQTNGGVYRGGSSSAYGGAILAVNSLLSVNDSTFFGNASAYIGGAIALVGAYADIISSTFSGNAAQFGGAISAADSTYLYLADSVLSVNEAGAGGAIIAGSLSEVSVFETDIDANFGVVYGGGVQVGFGNLITPIRNINSFESSISGAPNFSLTGPAAFNGTSTQISDNRTDYYGGGLSAKYDSEVTLTDSLVTGNRAEPPPPRDTGDPRGGGGTSYPGFGGGLLARSNAYIAGQGLTLSNNEAIYGGGGGADSDAALVLYESLIDGNVAEVGGGLLGGFFQEPIIYLDAAGSTGRGGGSSYNGVVGAVASTISNNLAVYGAGLMSFSDGAALSKYSQISGNVADSYGGGALAYASVLLIYGSQIADNSAVEGGGIARRGGTGETVIANSTISGNQALIGGGLDLRDGQSSVKYSTIAGNSADLVGGVIAVGTPTDPAVLINSTITNNSAEQVGGVYAFAAELDFMTISHNTATGVPPTPLTTDLDFVKRGLSENPGGALIDGDSDSSISNSIFADNISPGGTVDLAVVAGGGVVSLDYSLVETPGTGVPAGTGNLTGVDPQLGALADNGGQTLTRALPETSPAVDVGDPATSVSHDQRNDPFPRVFGGRADMGAFEFVIDGIFSDRFEQP